MQMTGYLLYQWITSLHLVTLIRLQWKEKVLQYFLFDHIITTSHTSNALSVGIFLSFPFFFLSVGLRATHGIERSGRL